MGNRSDSFIMLSCVLLEKDQEVVLFIIPGAPAMTPNGTAIVVERVGAVKRHGAVFAADFCKYSAKLFTTIGRVRK